MVWVCVLGILSVWCAFSDRADTVTVGSEEVSCAACRPPARGSGRVAWCLWRAQRGSSILFHSFFRQRQPDASLAISKEELPAAIQQAVDIEIATIPTYLSTYYSIRRVPDQAALAAKYTKILGGGANATETARDLSAQIMVLANQCGAFIMSVVVEEMLHMALSSNVHQALFGPPSLVGRSPRVWPTQLPGQRSPFDINRGPLSLAQLETFMHIEEPETDAPAPVGLLAAPLPMTTIGEFYDAIEAALVEYYPYPHSYAPSRPQLIPGKRYYAQNNINTNHYNKVHEPTFANDARSGDLIHVVDLRSARLAIHEIVRQGEGAKDKKRDAPDELAHYYKFARLHTEIGEKNREFAQKLGLETYDVLSDFVLPQAVNPLTQDFPEAVQASSNLTNALYTYLFVMTAACYENGGNRQFEIFMMGIHKTMMWIFGQMCESHMATYQYIGADGRSYHAAPTFEDWSFHTESSPKQQIVELWRKAYSYDPSLRIVGNRILDLPDVPLQAYLGRAGGAILA